MINSDSGGSCGMWWLTIEDNGGWWSTIEGNDGWWSMTIMMLDDTQWQKVMVGSGCKQCGQWRKVW